MKIGLGERTEMLTERIIRAGFRGLEGMSNSAFQDELSRTSPLCIAFVFLPLRPFAAAASKLETPGTRRRDAHQQSAEIPFSVFPVVQPQRRRPATHTKER